MGKEETMNLSISNFKKSFLFYLLPIVLFVVIGIFSFDYTFEKLVIEKTQSSTTGRLRYLFEEENKTIIPIIGSSRARCSYIPELINKDAFNFGMDGTSLVTSIPLLEYALQKENVHTAILNFDYDFWYYIGDKRDYLPLIKYPIIRKMLNSVNQLNFTDRIPGFRYFNTYDYYGKEFINEQLNITKEVRKGYTFDKNKKSFNKAEFASFIQERIDNKGSFKRNEKQISELFRVIDAFPNKEIIISIAPYHQSFIDNYTNLGEANKFLDNLNSKSNVKVFNPDCKEFPDSLFTNTSHLNYWGAIKNSQMLKEFMNSIQ